MSEESPLATDETNPTIDNLIDDVSAIKCAIMAFQEGQGHSEPIDAAFEALDAAWGHLMTIKVG